MNESHGLSYKEIKELSKLTKEEWREYSKSVWEIEGERKRKGHPAPFPTEIPKRLLKMYTMVYDVVLDPFMGIGSTMIAAHEHNRHSIGIECSKEYFNICNDVIDELSESDTTHKMYNNDARDMSFIDSESVECVITSPPYWTAVEYEDISGDNLGNIPDYEKFLDELDNVWSECYRVLKPGGKLCIIVSGIHKKTEQNIGKGKKYLLERIPIQSDITVRCRDIGFKVLGEIIWKKNRFGMTSRPIFGSYPYPRTILIADSHEYITVYRKTI